MKRKEAKRVKTLNRKVMSYGSLMGKAKRKPWKKRGKLKK
jgi:hypothetical protein